MSVHYKFKSALDFDTISFDGLHISVDDLKKAIIHQKRLGKTQDFDLQITNAQTKEGKYHHSSALKNAKTPKVNLIRLNLFFFSVCYRIQWRLVFDSEKYVVDNCARTTHATSKEIMGSECRKGGLVSIGSSTQKCRITSGQRGFVADEWHRRGQNQRDDATKHHGLWSTQVSSTKQYLSLLSCSLSVSTKKINSCIFHACYLLRFRYR